MRDSDVRAATKQMLASLHAGDPHTRIVEEMGIWSGSARIDVAVINGELHGYELKSERDTLERLPAQAKLYSQVFDRVILVAADRHLKIARKMIPRWWGVIVARADGDLIALHHAKEPKRNPSVDGVQLARLLWRSEALMILTRYGIDRGVRSRPIEIIFRRLAERLSPQELSREVREALKQRTGWLGQPVGNKGQMPIDANSDPRSAVART